MNILTDKIPLLTYYSPSHKILFDRFFLPSYNQYLSNSFELVIKTSDQLCNGEFGSINWNKQMKEKISFVNDFIQLTDAEYVVFSDVDIIFFDDIRYEIINELAHDDIAFQNDGGELSINHNLCCGFFICKIHSQTRAFFNALLSNYNDRYTDQQNMNYFLKNSSGVQYKPLSKRFYNLSRDGRPIWQSGQDIPFPDLDILMYHANFTVGLNSKKHLLENFIDWNELKRKNA
ncbi:putative nucleotide-diphospho-sugar transferase [Chitinophaga flava]|uniref:Nucleotide-diphospho-sugar transferase domain-containing protein n=1 Tax=Chitinophaga flava TaxID=2259036 RepID=A0A365XU18_9BACT|nr:putative nucleotide-diphospho-sugar transferase [Chitinophaga flava]RBL89640.1 hypothetical protein DF182_24375 [Chitinophaga flava]